MIGIPQIIAAQTTASADDALAVTLSPKTVNTGEMMARMLDVFEEAAMVVYCPLHQIIMGTTEGDVINMMNDMWDDDGAELKLNPRAGTYGGKLKFDVEIDTLGDADLTAKLTNNFQFRSLAGIINQANVARFKSLQPDYYLLIDQANSFVSFKTSAALMDAAILSLPVTGQTITLKLSTTKKAKLIFE